jgi:AcrR family transcriptional regulator
MISTKEKILLAATRCFNRDGLVNVRLQNIADEANMSVGNMAYHYRTKEIIVQAIWEELVKKQRQWMAEFRVAPLFEDLERQIRSTYELQQAHAFFYLDTLEVLRAYPEIALSHRQHLHWQIQQINSILQFNAARGAIISEPAEEHFLTLAQTFWMYNENWLYQQYLLGAADITLEKFRQSLWSLLLPYFTPMGQLEFSQLNALVLGNYF